MSTLSTRLRGLAATLALVAFVLGVPAVLVAIDAVPDLAAFSWSRLTAPDDGTLVVEIHRRRLLDRLGGLHLPARRIDRLAAPRHANARGCPDWPCRRSRPIASSPQLPCCSSRCRRRPRSSPSRGPRPLRRPLPCPTTPESRSSPPPLPAPTVEYEKEPEVERYTVKRGDSLWRIAEDRLGDGARYVELVALNEAVLDGRPDFLLPGTVLRVPVAETAPADAYVVQPGDTLSEIAEDELGEADAYPSIFEASRNTVQPDGARLTDPDLILPGWKLTIPGEEPPTESPGPRHSKPPEQVPESSTPPPTQATPSEPSDEARPESHESAQGADDSVVPPWLVPGLAGAGAILGGALWVTLRAQRRTQLRHRRPGTVIPPPPVELMPAEKTARATASVIAPRIDALDAALRSLPSLRLVTAALTAGQISLALRESADLPLPWSGSGTEWRIRLADVPDRPEDSFPPYPLLVSVGQTDEGSFLFLNLEELRTVTVTGDPDRKASFARHVAAELAVNPWSVVTTVDLLGSGPTSHRSTSAACARTRQVTPTSSASSRATCRPSPSRSSPTTSTR